MSKRAGAVAGWAAAALLGCSDPTPDNYPAPGTDPGYTAPSQPVGPPYPVIGAPNGPKLEVSGPGLSRPLPLDQVANVFANERIDPSFSLTEPFTRGGYYATLTKPLVHEVRAAGLPHPSLPLGPEYCDGCRPTGHINLFLSRPRSGVYRLEVRLRTPQVERTWAVERSEDNLIIPPANAESTHDSHVDSTVHADALAIGREVCRALLDQACQGGLYDATRER